jgi:hypothetical protein
MNYCKDCKYCPANSRECQHPGNRYASPLAVGESISFSVRTQRLGVVLLGSQCGVSGVWFSPKEPQYRSLQLGEIVPKEARFQVAGETCWYQFEDSVGAPYIGIAAGDITITATRCPANLKPVFPEPEIKRCKRCGDQPSVKGFTKSYCVFHGTDCWIGPNEFTREKAIQSWNAFML